MFYAEGPFENEHPVTNMQRVVELTVKQFLEAQARLDDANVLFEPARCVNSELYCQHHVKQGLARLDWNGGAVDLTKYDYYYLRPSQVSSTGNGKDEEYDRRARFRMGPYSLSYWVAFRVPFSAELKEQIAEAESGRHAGSPKLQASDEIDAMLARRGKAAGSDAIQNSNNAHKSVPIDQWGLQKPKSSQSSKPADAAKQPLKNKTKMQPVAAQYPDTHDYRAYEERQRRLAAMAAEYQTAGRMEQVMEDAGRRECIEQVEQEFENELERFSKGMQVEDKLYVSSEWRSYPTLSRSLYPAQISQAHNWDASGYSGLGYSGSFGPDLPPPSLAECFFSPSVRPHGYNAEYGQLGPRFY